jgi:Kef-type K+ transport system membrane component KefB
MTPQALSLFRLIRLPLVALLLLVLMGSAGEVHHGGAGHLDPVANVIIEILVIIFVARLGGHFAERWGHPPVLGELLTGVAIGALWLLPIPALVPTTLIVDARTADSHIDILARIGVILLLFEVGLETRLGELLKVGWMSVLVACTGVVVPFGLGWMASSWLVGALPAGVDPVHAHLFLGATLTATSVGITARVLKDLRQLERRESRIVLGAAVIDDVLGLIVLAVVGGIVTAARTGQTESVAGLALGVSAKAILFLGASILLGIHALPPVFRYFARFRNGRLVLSCSLGFCFLMAFLANEFGLATIVGAFAAGLVLEDRHLDHFKFDQAYKSSTEALHHLLYPLTLIFVPVFFVQMGIQVRLETFLNLQVLLLALALTVAAVVGKVACALVVPGRLWSRLTVGVGMIPRGEVGLIFANIGLAMGVISPGAFSAIVIMVVLTTFTTPLLLKGCLVMLDREEARAAAAGG